MSPLATFGEHPSKVPVTVVTGFLGAGKTTLVNEWLAGYAHAGKRLGEVEVAVVVNEHGTVGIDGELLAERVKTLVEITGGCVCCTNQAELMQALATLATQSPPPRRILVETSGAASPVGVLRALAAGGRLDVLALDGVVTVVDASRISALSSNELALEQLGCADLVVLSRSDLCDTNDLARARDWLSARNGVARVLCASRGRIEENESSLEAILDRVRLELPEGRPLPDAATSTSHGSDVYESVSLVLEGEVDDERFADFMEHELARFSGRLHRTKGILSIAGVRERMIVQGVADLVEVTFAPPLENVTRTSRLVVVGFGLDREALTRAFAACATDT